MVLKSTDRPWSTPVGRVVPKLKMMKSFIHQTVPSNDALPSPQSWKHCSVHSCWGSSVQHVLKDGWTISCATLLSSIKGNQLSLAPQSPWWLGEANSGGYTVIKALLQASLKPTFLLNTNKWLVRACLLCMHTLSVPQPTQTEGQLKKQVTLKEITGIHLQNFSPFSSTLERIHDTKPRNLLHSPKERANIKYNEASKQSFYAS